MKPKICTKCKKRKNINEFSFRNKSKGTYQSECKDCFKLRDKLRWNNNENLLKKKRTQQKVIRERNKQFLIDYKKSHPCIDCGEKDVVVLEFDHIRGKKEMNVSDMQTVSIKKLESEISKCEIRCANCHKRRHNKVVA